MKILVGTLKPALLLAVAVVLVCGVITSCSANDHITFETSKKINSDLFNQIQSKVNSQADFPLKPISVPTTIPIDSSTGSIDKKDLIPLPVGDRTGLPPEDHLVFDPEIVNLSPEFILIAVNEPEKPNALEIINASSASAEEKLAARESLKKLWEKYPVVFEKVDNETTLVRLKNSNVRKEIGSTPVALSVMDNETLNIVARTFWDGEKNQLAKEQTAVKNVGTAGPITNWVCNPTHTDLAYHSTRKVLSDDDAFTVFCYVSDPDNPIVVPVVLAPGWFLYPPFISQAVLSWTHYYNPESGWGGAPDAEVSTINTATSYFNANNRPMALKYAGYACHYLSDVGNPLHTGLEGWQITNMGMHGRYETWVAEEAYTISGRIQADNYYYTINDVATAVRDLSGDAHQNLNTVYYACIYNAKSTACINAAIGTNVAASRLHLGMLQRIGLW